MKDTKGARSGDPSAPFPIGITRPTSRVGQNRTYSPYMQGWPEPYIYTVYDRIFGDFLAKNTVHTPCIYIHIHIYIYIYIYGSGQPYVHITVYLVSSLPKVPYVHVSTWFWPALRTYNRILGEFPAKSTVCAPFVHSSDQPYNGYNGYDGGGPSARLFG